MSVTQRHYVGLGKRLIEYDYEGHPEMPMEIENLTGQVAVFMRGRNTHYDYGKGVNYRVGGAIKNNKDPKKELKKMFKLTREKGSLTPFKIYVMVSHPDHLSKICKAIEKFYGKDELPYDLKLMVYGYDEVYPDANSTAFRTPGSWTASLAFDTNVKPTIIRVAA